MVQRKFSEFLHSFCETSLRLFYVPVPRSTQGTLQPLITIGYRTAIVDTLGPAGLNMSQSSDLNRLLYIFHRDHPQTSRNLPKWNLSVLLNKLTKAHNELMKETDFKQSYPQNCYLASFSLWQALQRNSCCRILTYCV